MNARGQRGLGVASAPNIVKKFNVCPSHSCLIRFKRQSCKLVAVIKYSAAFGPPRSIPGH
jgi:hypothetical protein